jgi:hypothetical protein
MVIFVILPRGKKSGKFNRGKAGDNELDYIF